MKKEIYLFDSKMSLETFKLLNEKFGMDSGPSPKNINKVLHKMMADKQIYIWLDPEDKEDPIHIGQELPQVKELEIIYGNPRT